MKERFLFIWVSIILLVPAISVEAQAQRQISLSLSRDFGFSLGSRMQGNFSYHVSGPDNLVRVVFLMDGESIGEDTEPPFRWQIRTESYPLGIHTMNATGYTRDGQELESNVIQRQFVAGSDSTQVELWIIVLIITLSLGVRLLTSWIANRGPRKSSQPAISGPFGGTLCPKCGRPFAMHIWGLNVVAGKFDRCPHCGKWSLVRRVHPDILAGAVEAFADDEKQDTPPPNDDPQSLSKRLDESRFDDL
jgi:hypothetical protein